MTHSTWSAWALLAMMIASCATSRERELRPIGAPCTAHLDCASAMCTSGACACAEDPVRGPFHDRSISS